jgi:GTP-binding protein HflX
MPGGREVLFTDTVGFIQKLPTQIVAAFRATLEEIADADVLLHVVDVTHPHVTAQIEAVEDTLADLEVDHLPTVIALNKIDALPDGAHPLQELELFDPAVLVSARTGYGLDDLMVAIEAAMVQYLHPLHVLLPYKRGDLLAMLYERGQVDGETHLAEGVEVYGRLPARLLPYFTQYLANNAQPEDMA